MNTAYRDLDTIAEQRMEAMAARRQDELALLDAAPGVYRRRVARTFAGIVAAAGGLAMFGVALIQTHAFFGNTNTDGLLTTMLLGSTALGAFTYFVASVIAAIRIRSALEAEPRSTGDAAADLARAEASLPSRVVMGKSAAWESASIAAPLVAVSLLAPLTIHLGFIEGLHALTGSRFETKDFDQWIAMSALIVGHAHLALCICCIFFARALRRMNLDEVRQSLAAHWGKALGITVGVSALPGLIFLAVPPILTAVTGGAFIPAMFYWIRRRIAGERRLLYMEAIA